MIRDIQLPLISYKEARELNDNLNGLGNPTENRVLIAVPANNEVKKGNLILPGQNKEELPRKGVIVQKGYFTDEYRSYSDLKIGDIVTYGMYAGKEIDPPFGQEFKSIHDTTELKFFVLSLNEIIYSEINFNE